jgi:hypothetical protein
MAGITPAAVTAVTGSFATNPSYSGTFIPTLWSAKLNAKFYTASTFADICNRDWEGDVSNLGDKVVINNIPNITISNYSAGSTLTYQVPTPNTVELALDKAKYFGFQVNDVLEFQAKPDLMNTFSDDASEQMRIAIDSTCIYGSFMQGDADNRGTAAGVGNYGMGTDATPIALNATAGNANNVLTKILEMASVLDERNVPESNRWIVIDPAARVLLMQTNLAQANLMGDAKSPVRNGMIGMIDRFKVYVSNNLPRGAAGTAPTGNWVSGDGTETSVAVVGTGVARKAIIAGHTSAVAFASQISKVETLRNPTDFGDYIRGLQIFGHKVVVPTALVTMVATAA